MDPPGFPFISVASKIELSHYEESCCRYPCADFRMDAGFQPLWVNVRSLIAASNLSVCLQTALQPPPHFASHPQRASFLLLPAVASPVTSEAGSPADWEGEDVPMG